MCGGHSVQCVCVCGHSVQCVCGHSVQCVMVTLYSVCVVTLYSVWWSLCTVCVCVCVNVHVVMLARRNVLHGGVGTRIFTIKSRPSTIGPEMTQPSSLFSVASSWVIHSPPEHHPFHVCSPSLHSAVSSILFKFILHLSILGFVKFFLWVVFMDCIGVGLLLSTIMW